MESVFFKNNRNKLCENIKDNSIVILLSGKAVKKIGDENYPFTPQRNFYYMTGLDRENMIVVMTKKGSSMTTDIFVERYDEVKAKWVGAVMLPNEVRKISGIENVRYIDEFDEVLGSIIFNNRIENVYMDIENRDMKVWGESIPLAERIAENYPYINVVNV